MSLLPEDMPIASTAVSTHTEFTLSLENKKS